MTIFTVTTLDDEDATSSNLASETADGNGLSLREALFLARDGDTIVFDTGTDRVLRLTQGTLVVAQDTTIDGGGLITITGDANNDDTVDARGITLVNDSTADQLDDNTRLFTSLKDLTLTGLVLTGGRTEGDSDFSGLENQGGAIHMARDDAQLTITQSTIAGNSTSGTNSEGGAIYALGVVDIEDSTITGNVTEGLRSFGGAIYAQSTVVLKNTTLAYNETQGDRGYGGALFADGGTVTVINSTIVGNKTLGEINNSEDFKAGSAIYSDNTLLIANSIILDNTSQDGGPQLQEKDATGQGDGVVGFFGNNITSDVPAAAYSANVIDATVDQVFAGGLIDNGGPVYTFALKADATNPAIDASSGLVTSEDARGVAAYDVPDVGGSSGLERRDLGAFEINKPLPETQSLIVTTTDDVVDAFDGVTSLREAVAFANAQAGTDTITFDTDGQGLIRLTNGEIEITDALIIDGDGAVTITGDAGNDDLTVDGVITDVAASGADRLDDNSRIFRSTGDLTIEGLTLTGGRAGDGGAISLFNDSLTVSDSVLVGNSATSKGGALYGRDVTVSASELRNNESAGVGGAVFGGFKVGIYDSTISDNTAEGKGGGIYINYIDGGSFNADASTISGNTTLGERGHGGGVFAATSDVSVTGSTISGNVTKGATSFGAGIYALGLSWSQLFDDPVEAKTISISNSTIADNETQGAGGYGAGIFANGGFLKVTSSTITGNNTLGLLKDPNSFKAGPGIYSDNEITITNSIAIGNSAATGGPEIQEKSGSGDFVGNGVVTFAGTNIIGAGTASDNGGTVINATVEQVFDGGLADNGGPVQTVALKADAVNPALDAATISGDDARGLSRGFDQTLVDNGGTSDLGAFELQSQATEAGSLIVTTTDDVVDATDGVTSLREAVAFANAQTGDDTITFDTGGQGLIRLTNGEIAITDALIIDGDGAVTITGDAGNDDIKTDGVITDVAASGADRLDDNSRIFKASDALTLDGLTLTGGRTTGTNEYGGAVDVKGGSLTITNSTISGNSTAGGGGAGGGVYAFGAITITNSTISGNSTAGFAADGGGVYADGAITIIDSTISGNSTAGVSAGGGGVYADGAITITNSTISGNSTAGTDAGGGGVYAHDEITIMNSTISGNSTTGEDADGGGVYANGAITITNSTISGNSTAGTDADGGGVYADGALTVTDSIVLGNTSQLATGNELYSGNNGGSSRITFNGTSLISAGGDAVSAASINGSGVVANAADVFAQTVDNNGVTAGALADNGGPVQTVALKADADNPALDAATISGDDARGLSRGFDQTLVDNGGTSDLGAFELQSQATLTGSLVVTTTDDVVDATDGVTSLREAVAFANAKTGDDTITFDTGGQGLIRLTQGQIDITDDVIIDGGGTVTITGDAGNDDITVDGDITDVDASGADLLDDNSSIFRTDPFGDRINITLDGLTLTGGRTTERDASGGAVYATGNLTVQNSVVSGNSTSGNIASGGGFAASDYLTVSDSVISGNRTFGEVAHGGGLAGTGFSDVTVTNSSVFDNLTLNERSTGGGILSVFGDITLTNASVSDNHTAGIESEGGGIISFFGDITLTNSTVSGNSTSGDNSSGGGLYTEGNVTIVSSTITGNSATGAGSVGGGVVGLTRNASVEKSQISVTDSIVLGNFAAGGAQELLEVDIIGVLPVFGQIEVIGTNIIGADSAAFDVSSESTGAGTALNADAEDVFAQTVDNNGVTAGAVADNSGPVQTVALKADADNPALDAATITGTDARGEDRGFDQTLVDNGGTSDLGAFELQSQATEDGSLVVTTTADVVNATDGVTSLREAVAFANAQAGDDTITFDTGGQGLLRLTQGEIAITDALIIDGDGAVTITGDAGNDDITTDGLTDVDESGANLLDDNSRIFTSDSDLTIENLTLTGGFATTGGGAVAVNGEADLTITNSTLSGNATNGTNSNGGAVLSDTGDVTLTGSTFAGNATLGGNSSGGAVFGGNGALSATDTTFSRNIVEGDLSNGGAVFHRLGTIELTNSDFTDNATLKIDGDGGAVYSSGAQLTITGGTFSGNSTTGENAAGGAIYSRGAITLNDAVVTGNGTSGDSSTGGGIAGLGVLNINESTITGNQTGGISSIGGSAYAAGQVTVLNSTISGNSTNATSSAGGAIFGRAGISVTDSSLTGNVANSSNSGGGALAAGGDVTITNSEISGNATKSPFSAGGGVVTFGGDVSVSGSLISGNTTDGQNSFGGGLATFGDTTTLSVINSTVAGNQTTGDGSGGGGALSQGTVVVRNSTFTNNSVAGENSASAAFVGIGGITVEDSIALGNFAETFTVNNVGFGGGSLDAEAVFLGLNILGPENVKSDRPNVITADAALVFAQTVDNNGELAGVLADNGGPLRAVALNADVLNPALDAASGSGVDMRGFAVFDLGGVDNGGTKDLGAFELQSADVSAGDPVLGETEPEPQPQPEPQPEAGPTNGNDILIGTDGADTISGLGGDDTITGLKGADLLFGGADDDVLNGNGGADKLRGGAGSDALNGGGGRDNLKGNGGADTLRGGGAADKLFGGGGKDKLIGGGGKDKLVGGGGKDNLNGGGGADNLQGGKGNDRLKGGGGKDKLDGDRGIDKLTGGKGADVFVFDDKDSGTGRRADTITDFNGRQDKINLRKVDADTTTGRDDAFTFNGQTAQANSVWFESAGQGIKLMADVNGDRTADFQIKLNGISSLSADDLIL